MDTKFKINFWNVIAAMALLLLFQSWWVQSQQVETIPFSKFETLVDGKKIKDVFVTPDYITGTLKEPLKDGRTEFTTTRVDPALTERLAKEGVVVTGVVPSTFLSDLLSWVVPALVFVVIWMLVVRRFAANAQQTMGGLMSIGQSKARSTSRRTRRRPSTTSPVSMRPRPKSRRWWTFTRTRRPMAGSGPSCRRACCSVRPAPARLCLPGQWRARPGWRSSRSAARISSRCSSASVLRACAISSSRRPSSRPPSSSSTSSTPSVAPGRAAGLSVATTKRSRRSISF